MPSARSIASASLLMAPSEPGTTGRPSSIAASLAAHLVAHQRDVLGRRADEGEAVLLDHGGELGVLGQEADARMDRIGAGDGGRGQDGRHVEVALAASAAGRCRRSRRPGAHASRRRRRWNARPRCGCPSRGRRGGCAARSRRGWRSGPFRTCAACRLRSCAAAGQATTIRTSPYSTGRPSSTRISLHRAGVRRRDRIHHLHRLDDQQGLALLHAVADLDEGIAARRLPTA